MISLLLLGTLLVSVASDSPSASLCAAHNATSQTVVDFCRERGGSLQARCCYAPTARNILAIDLTTLDLSRVPALHEDADLLNVTLIDLRSNAQLKAAASGDFVGLRRLESLYLPPQFVCPGGRRVWQVINQTSDPPGFVCLQQNDLCAEATAVCPQPNSECVANGPNRFLCLCKTGFYGYKCFRHGQFPYVAFGCISVAITAVLSAFFYVTHRRNVKRD